MSIFGVKVKHLVSSDLADNKFTDRDKNITLKILNQ